MSEQPQASNQSSGPAAKGSEVQFDTRTAVPVYANVFRASAIPTGEIILDCGLNDQQAAAAGSRNIPVAYRLVLAHPTAQRLADLLHALLRQYQQSRFPPIHVQRMQQPLPAIVAAPQPEPSQHNGHNP